MITGLHGAPVAGRMLPDARRQLRTAAAGARIAVTYVRAGAQRDAVLTLRDQIPVQAAASSH